jgi:enediyne biosynthesis protein CalE5
MSRSFAEQQRIHWDNVAEGWTALSDWTERNFAPLTDWLAEALVLAPGVRVLDVACGVGFPALPLAQRVMTGGGVIAVDLSHNMLTAAARLAAARELTNVEFRHMDAERLTFDEGTFDGVTNTYGLMFCTDPVRAVQEARRVLKPGGCLAIVVWDEPARNPFFEVITSVARPVLRLTVPQTDAPGPFRFAQPGALADVITRSGLSRLRIEPLEMIFDCGSAEEYVNVFRNAAWKARIDALSDAERTRLTEQVAEAAQAYVQEGRLRLPTTSLCAVAQR